MTTDDCCDGDETTVKVADPALARRALLLEAVTIGWNSIEALVAIGAGIIAGSVALTGFGGDSVIEVFAAAVVTIRLSATLRGHEPDEAKEKRALRLIACTFFVLAAAVTISGARDLLSHAEPEASPVGIGITALSLVVMPLLARSKRRVGMALGNDLVVADASETSLCAYLSASTLAGLVLYATLGWWWADPVAGFVIAGFAVKEGREAWKGDLCCD